MNAQPEQSEPSLVTRLWFAWLCLIKVLFDNEFAKRAWALREPAALPPGLRPSAQLPLETGKQEPPLERKTDVLESGALELLAILQREGRLIDFLEQDVAPFGDADVGAAARAVHEGCRRALHAHVKIESLRSEEEGSSVLIPQSYSSTEVKLVGNLHGSGPFRGTLRHRGWRATEVRLPEALPGHDATVLAPAEVEL